ncbi:MAG: hypothetical protein F4Y49_11585 [Dehalococcoidia bacterium]|nr:hypothetical protein [Dehalococcoidia bacterium]
MSVNDAILAILADESTHGRTMLQKKMYFLSVLANENFGFRPHFFGPYSSQVSTSLSALGEADFVKETRMGYGIPTNFGEMSRYDYDLSDSGKEVVGNRPEIKSRYSEYLDRINDSGVASDINTISIAAKVHFILSDQGEATSSQITEQAESLGWNVSGRDIRRVVQSLESLGLVTYE